MIGLRLSLIWNLIFLVSFTYNNLSEASDPKKLSSAVVVGTVYCDTCFHQEFSKASHFISDALVAVECSDRSSRPSFRQVVRTNEHGEFKVHLPFSVSKHVKKIKGCSVKLISSNEPYCAVASTATSSSLRLKSRKKGTHIFSAGFFTFKPLKQPELCDQKPSIQNIKKLNAVKSSLLDPNGPTFFPPIQNPTTSDLLLVGQIYLPPLPQLPNLPPLPQLPPLPTLPGIPYIPPPSIFPPIFPSPPPSSFPPIFPSPPPSTFPPVFPLPSSPPLKFSPLIPGGSPSPPSFPFPLPPFPFQPTPGFPGVPPAVHSSSSSSSQKSLP